MEQDKQKDVVTITCPYCGSLKCYEEKYPEAENEGVPKGLKGYLCKNCGMTSSSEFKDGSPYLKKALATMPDMLKDMKFYDEDRKIYWFLAIVQTPVGHVFPEPDEKDWHWTYMPVVEVADEDAEEYPVPGKEGTFYSHRLADDQAVKFHKSDFAKALAMVGLTEKK